MPTILTTTGEVNLRDASAKVCIFHTPKDGSVERYLSQAAKSAQHIQQRGSATFLPSIQGVLSEIGGRSINAAYAIQNGEVIKVFVKIKYGYGRMDKVGSFFLRAREDAAYRVLTIKTLDMASVLFRSAKIEGCFDLLTLQQGLAEGVKINNTYHRLFNPDNLSSIIETTILQPERTPAVSKEVVTVTDSLTGKEVSVVKVKRRRAISL
jgi:hypothetical protein